MRLYIGRIQERHDLIAGRGWWGYTSAWEGRSRLNVRWGAGLPLSIECHPPAQATLLTNIGDWR